MVPRAQQGRRRVHEMWQTVPLDQPRCAEAMLGLEQQLDSISSWPRSQIFVITEDRLPAKIVLMHLVAQSDVVRGEEAMRAGIADPFSKPIVSWLVCGMCARMLEHVQGSRSGHPKTN